MRVLIIANARYKGGLSGSDAIYENFRKHWPCETFVSECMDLDYNPFTVCYLDRIIRGVFRALFDSRDFDFVYSASDFFPDVIPAVIYKIIKRKKWVAGYYLSAFKENKFHYWTQKMVRWLINRFSDMVIVTNPLMLRIFPDKKKTWINGGIESGLTKTKADYKIYDVVFCGRIHPSKGIDEMIDIWRIVREKKPTASMVVIGDGDLGKEYIKTKLGRCNGVIYLGYMGRERYDIYRQSKIVIYPTPLKYDHFSMSPVEAMACGCPCVSFDTPTIAGMNPKGWIWVKDIQSFADVIVHLLRNTELRVKVGEQARHWALQFEYKEQVARVFNNIKQEILS